MWIVHSVARVIRWSVNWALGPPPRVNDRAAAAAQIDRAVRRVEEAARACVEREREPITSAGDGAPGTRAGHGSSARGRRG